MKGCWKTEKPPPISFQLKTNRSTNPQHQERYVRFAPQLRWISYWNLWCRLTPVNPDYGPGSVLQAWLCCDTNCNVLRVNSCCNHCYSFRQLQWICSLNFLFVTIQTLWLLGGSTVAGCDGFFILLLLSVYFISVRVGMKLKPFLA